MTKKYWLGFAVILAFISIKFYPVFLVGKMPIPMDILAGGYWPWRLVDYGYPAGVPIKNPIVSDVVSQLFIWNDLFWSLGKQGLLPLWDRYSLLGYPYYANYHSAVFYPLNLIGFFVDSITARTLVLLLTQIIAAFGVYGYLVYKNKSKASAVIAAIFFISAGQMTTDFLFSSGSRAVFYMPYIFWATDLYFDRGKSKYLKILSASWLILILSGHFQITVFSTVIWLSYVSTRDTSSTKKLKALLYWLLGITASFVQLIPTIELLAHSFRNGETYISQVNYGLLPARHLVTLFFAPDTFGNNATGNYFGFWNYRESIGYLGLIPGFFILLGLLKKPKNFFSILFVVSLVMIFVPPFGKLVYQLHVPLISGSAASRWLFISVFAGAILVSEGFDVFLRKNHWPTLVLYCTIFLAILTWFFAEKIAYTYAGFDLGGEQYFKNNMVSIRNMVIPAANMFVLFVFAVILSVRRNFLRNLVAVCLVAVVCFDFLRFHFKFNGFVSRKINPQTYSLESKISTKKRISATSDELFPPNSSTLLRVPSVLGYDPLYPIDNGIYLNAINGDNDPQHVGRYYNKISNTKSKLLDYAGVEYLATLTRGKDGLLSDKGDPPYFIDTNKWKPAYREKEMLILQNNDSLPLFYLPKNITNVPMSEHIQLMNQSTNDTAYADGIELSVVSKKTNISYKIYENGEADVSLQNNNDAFLVYNQADYPGWEAMIDGKPTKIYRTNYLFQGISVPSGDHKIVWRFRPKSFYFGGFVSIFSLLVISLYRDEQETRGVS